MERYAWKATVKDGMLAEYCRRHNEIWDEMKEVLRAAGIRNYTIWNVGNELFGYYECELGKEYAARVQATSPVVDRWNAYMTCTAAADAGLLLPHRGGLNEHRRRPRARLRAAASSIRKGTRAASAFFGGIRVARRRAIGFRRGRSLLCGAHTTGTFTSRRFCTMIM